MANAAQTTLLTLENTFNTAVKIGNDDSMEFFGYEDYHLTADSVDYIFTVFEAGNVELTVDEPHDWCAENRIKKTRKFKALANAIKGTKKVTRLVLDARSKEQKAENEKAMFSAAIKQKEANNKEWIEKVVKDFWKMREESGVRIWPGDFRIVQGNYGTYSVSYKLDHVNVAHEMIRVHNDKIVVKVENRMIPLETAKQYCDELNALRAKFDV